MGLYRQIAGSNLGAIQLLQPLITTIPTQPISQTAPSLQPVIDLDQAQADYNTEINSKYDYIMSHSVSEITAGGIFVGPDGSLFIGDPSTQSGVAWLVLYSIQDIENARGTPGALLTHMQEPILAADTAGYQGGGSASAGSPPVIPTVPDVTTTQPVSDTPVAVTPATPLPVPSTQIPTITTTSSKTDWGTVLTVGGLIFLMVKGEPLLGKNRKIALIGGVALLYYHLNKK